MSTSPSAGASRADLDAVITSIVGNNSKGVTGDTDVGAINAAVSSWTDVGDALVLWLNADPSGPSVSLGYLVAKYLPGWTGKGADAFGQAVSEIIDFGGKVGQAAYNKAQEDYAASVSGYDPVPATFRTSLTHLESCLYAIWSEHQTYQQEYNGWVANVANALWIDVLSIRVNGDMTTPQPRPGASSPWSGASWTVTWTTTIQNANTQEAVATNRTFTFTVQDDSRQTQTLVLTQDLQSGNPPSMSMSHDGNKVYSGKDLESWVRGGFTTLYCQRAGYLVDRLISQGGSVYDEATQLLPYKRDESHLPGASGSNGGGPGTGSPYGGYGTGGIGGGIGGLPGGTGTGIGGTGTGGLPGGSGGGTGGFGGGTGGLPGGTGGGSGSGGLPSTQLAGYTPPSGGSGVGGLSGLSGLGSGGLGTGSGGLGTPGGLGTGGGGLGAGGVPGESAAASGLAGAAGRSGMPMMPPMMPPGAGNQDRDRQRKSWLPEDEDIWGTEADGVPPVISGES